jgi:hypothetical protein
MKNILISLVLMPICVVETISCISSTNLAVSDLNTFPCISIGQATVFVHSVEEIGGS